MDRCRDPNGDTRKGAATIVCRRPASADGDSRPLASCDTGMDESATGDKVYKVPASGGKTRVITLFGCRIRCAIYMEEELRKYILDERSKQEKWTHTKWSEKINAIAAENRWGVHTHGGNRKCNADAKPAAGGDDSADRGSKMQPEGKMKDDAENAVAGPAAGGDDSADVQPGGKSKRLCTGVNLGYTLISPPLGAGTFGTTYHAVWKNGATDAGGQHVVVKHIQLARPDKSVLKEEAREVEILSTLHHKNVVKLLYAVQTPFALDLLLEVCDADLRSVLRRRDMTEAESKDAIRQICHGLEYIHDRNVLHRDVKPANILMQKVRGHSVYKLGDFGGARSCTPRLLFVA